MTLNNTKVFKLIKKKTAILIGMMIFLLMISSAYFLSYEAAHHCEDEDCPVCECIHICEEAVRRITSAGEVFVLFLMFGVILSKDNDISELLLKSKTPVNRKIRLND